MTDYPWQDEETLLNYYNDGLDPKEIADKLGCHYSTIYSWLKRFGIEFQDPKKRPPTIWTDKNGYVRVRSEYKGEDYNFSIHRLLAVSEYGFDSVSGMEVHHKNGIPWANWPDNLELLTKEEHGRISAAQRWDAEKRTSATS